MVLEEKPFEEGVYELSPVFVRSQRVERLRRAQEMQVRLQDVRSDGELLPRLMEPILRALSLDLQAAKAAMDLLARQRTIGCQVQESFLSDIELSQLLSVVRVQVTYGPLLIVHRLFNH